MAAQDRIAGSAAVAVWSAALDELHGRIAGRFARSEARQRARLDMMGLLGRVKRKNGWQLAEAIGEKDPRGVQRLLHSAEWDADAVRDDLREYVVEHLADEGTGILIADETGLLKKGEKSVGVARQYTGTAGDTVNCQVGVFVCYVSEEGSAFIDRALYLPRERTDDSERLSEASVPEGAGFATNGELAKGMLQTAFEADVPARWIVADTSTGCRAASAGSWRRRNAPMCWGHVFQGHLP